MIALLLSLALLVSACGGHTANDSPSSPAPTESPPEPSPPPETANPKSALPQEVGTTQNEDLRATIRHQMWQTPLGHMFHAYLFDDPDGTPNTSAAHDIAFRLFSQPTLSLTRVSALQVMIEDLYEQRQMSPSVNDRISLLETTVDLERHVLQNKVSNDLLKTVPLFIAAGFLGGSPLVRHAVMESSYWAFWRTLGEAGSKRALAKSAEFLEQIPGPQRLMSGEVFVGYNPYHGGVVFLNTFGSYAIVYYSLQTGSTDSATIQNKVWLYGLQNLIDINEI